MKAQLLLPFLVILAVLSCLLISPCRATVINFDDVPIVTPPHEVAQPTRLTNYQGFVWSRFLVENEILSTNSRSLGISGFYYGMVSPSNAAFNGGSPAEIDSPTNFNFLSVYLTGGANNNLNIEVQGFRDDTLLYDETVIANATNHALFTFNYQNINRLIFSSFGGQRYDFPNQIVSEDFVMDDFTYELVPEPSALLLISAGVAMLCAFHKRKRA